MRITILPGDGVGPEVTREAVKVLTEIAIIHDLEIEFDEQLIGGAAIRATGSPLPEETRAASLASDAVLLGAVGSPEFDDLLPEQRPEIGLLQLRQLLGGFANLRPAKAFPALTGSSPLRDEVFEGTDLLIVRELLGGLYFGQPRGIDEVERAEVEDHGVDAGVAHAGELGDEDGHGGEIEFAHRPYAGGIGLPRDFASEAFRARWRIGHGVRFRRRRAGQRRSLPVPEDRDASTGGAA